MERATQVESWPQTPPPILGEEEWDVGCHQEGWGMWNKGTSGTPYLPQPPWQPGHVWGPCTPSSHHHHYERKRWKWQRHLHWGQQSGTPSHGATITDEGDG